MTKNATRNAATPGPWRTVQEHGARLYTVTATARKVASVEMIEDARLIAAAPELFAALERATELLLPTNEHESAEYSSWLALLARITGDAT